MRLSPYPHLRLSSVVVLTTSLPTAISLTCSDVRADGVSFDFGALGGPHSLYKIKEHPNGVINTTFTIDICQPLAKQKGVAKEEDCPNNTRGRPMSWQQWPHCCILASLAYTFPLQSVPSNAYTIGSNM